MMELVRRKLLRGGPGLKPSKRSDSPSLSSTGSTMHLWAFKWKIPIWNMFPLANSFRYCKISVHRWSIKPPIFPREKPIDPKPDSLDHQIDSLQIHGTRFAPFKNRLCWWNLFWAHLYPIRRPRSSKQSLRPLVTSWTGGVALSRKEPGTVHITKYQTASMLKVFLMRCAWVVFCCFLCSCVLFTNRELVVKHPWDTKYY